MGMGGVRVQVRKAKQMCKIYKVRLVCGNKAKISAGDVYPPPPLRSGVCKLPTPLPPPPPPPLPPARKQKVQVLSFAREGWALWTCVSWKSAIRGFCVIFIKGRGRVGVKGEGKCGDGIVDW